MDDWTAATIADIYYAYRLLLERAPDAVGQIHFTKLIDEGGLALGRLRQELLASEEHRSVAGVPVPESKDSPLFHYNACFDVPGTVLRHAAKGLVPHPSYLTNFLGVLIDPKFFPDLLSGRANEVEPPPIPANWHADLAEWAAALRAVELAGPKFTMIELGCGWGCWMNNTGVAARSSGRTVQLIGVEGDAAHVSFARESLSTNGFDPADVTLELGIAAATSGTALFPQDNRDGQGWGAQPIFGATEAEREEAARTGRYDVLRMLSLADLTEGVARVDLLHVDIQGGEADLVAGSLATLTEKVHYLVIGTHSRALEGRLHELLLSAGWYLEVERPGLLHLNTNQPTMHIDGVQGWRNAALD